LGRFKVTVAMGGSTSTVMNSYPTASMIGHVGTGMGLAASARDSGIQVARMLGAGEHARERIA
jgi:hypothetical protein